jgi:hypothetical protein
MGRTRSTTSPSQDRRAAATAELLAAAQTINTMFDRADVLRGLLGECVTAVGDSDVVRSARTVINLAERISESQHQLLDAAAAAAVYRSRRELAADLNTSTALLFPRSERLDQPPGTDTTLERTAASATSSAGGGMR